MVYYNNSVIEMKELFANFYDIVMNFIASLGIYAPIVGSLLIILESILPMLPLFVFITMNFIAFGKFLGFIISWLCTIIGCSISYFLVRKLGYNYVKRRIPNESIIKKSLTYVQKLSLTKITVILAVPFTPAFMVNIAAGLANMEYKKFLIAITISKIFLVYFWGVVGTGLIESMRNPRSLITVIIMMVVAYIASLIINKLFKLD